MGNMEGFIKRKLIIIIIIIISEQRDRCEKTVEPLPSSIL